MTITAPDTKIDRDRWGRPYITPDGGGKAVAYTRATTLAGSLDDLNGLMAWKQRMTAIGLSDREDLLLAVAAHRGDKREMDRICSAAMEAAASSSAATTGTALHSLTEQADRGQEIGRLPAVHQQGLDAYLQATKDLTAVHIEQMCVIDDLKVAGTPDRVVEHEGRLRIADIKTGSIDFPHKIAIQLALYAHSRPYDFTTGRRGTWGDVDTQTALIIHLPAWEGTCRIVPVDIAAGWEAVTTAASVRAWRKRRDLVGDPIVTVDPKSSAPATVTPLPEPAVTPTPQPVNDDLAQAIASAVTVDALNGLWADHQTSWTAEHTELAATRKRLLATAS